MSVIMSSWFSSKRGRARGRGSKVRCHIISSWLSSKRGRARVRGSKVHCRIIPLWLSSKRGRAQRTGGKEAKRGLSSNPSQHATTRCLLRTHTRNMTISTTSPTPLLCSMLCSIQKRKLNGRSAVGAQLLQLYLVIERATKTAAVNMGTGWPPQHRRKKLRWKAGE